MMPDFATHIMETERSWRLKRNAVKEKKMVREEKRDDFQLGC